MPKVAFFGQMHKITHYDYTIKRLNKKEETARKNKGRRIVSLGK